ncbi:hypothetical protein [Geothermobacter hydrogeniphilus]|uniref:Uncharacterized protein n=1 Tax=Geothermobacter hydrogeniphilus TaxID=1969733 RepID=A0A1X0Y872_9BACT|nr:hypothetical protein [Geothermobacter hydrogeniphilus]ORJ61312.1 hypothetical protein B5V00_06685 [Geothermobacter hydrogeniphilus]
MIKIWHILLVTIVCFLIGNFASFPLATTAGVFCLGWMLGIADEKLRRKRANDAFQEPHPEETHPQETHLTAEEIAASRELRERERWESKKRSMSVTIGGGNY